MAELSLQELRWHALHRQRDGGLNVSGFDLSGLDLSGVRWLRGANLQRANLQGCTLAHVDLSDANLDGADLRRVKAQGTTFRDVSMVDTDCRFGDFAGAKFNPSRTSKIRADFRNADLRGAAFHDTNQFAFWVTSHFAGANLEGASLSAKDGGCFFEDANLAGATLRFFEAFRGTLRRTNLTGATWRETRFSADLIIDAASCQLDGLRFVECVFEDASPAVFAFRAAAETAQRCLVQRRDPEGGERRQEWAEYLDERRDEAEALLAKAG